jgi:hypothetical protein
MVYNWPSENVDAIVVTDGRCARQSCAILPAEVDCPPDTCPRSMLTLLSSAAAGYWGSGILASTEWLFRLVGAVSAACWLVQP